MDAVETLDTLIEKQDLANMLIEDALRDLELYWPGLVLRTTDALVEAADALEAAGAL